MAANTNFLEIFIHVGRGKQNSNLSWVIERCPSWPSVCPEFGKLLSPTSGYRRLINAFPCWSHWHQSLPFLVQTRLPLRKAEPPRSRSVPGMVVAPCDEVKYHTSTRGYPLSSSAGCHYHFLKATHGRHRDSPSSCSVFICIPPVFVNQTALVNYNEPFEPGVFCLLFHRLRNVCHSLLLAPRRYAEIFRHWSRHSKDKWHSLEYGHLLVYGMDWHWMPVRICQLGCVER